MYADNPPAPLPERTPERGSNPAPLWAQAADVIVEEIIGRRSLSPGDKLPPERELCTLLGVSRITLRKALTHLVERGLVTASHGRGWFVAAPVSEREWPNELESFSATARRKHMEPGSIVLRLQSHTATLDEADRLDLPPGAPLMLLERIRLLNGIRIAVDLTLMPLSAAPDLLDADFSSASLFEELSARGIELGRSETTIEARGADPVLADHLQVEPGASLLVLDQTVYSRARRPLLLSRVQYNGERYRLRTTFHQN